jgi:two-component system, chemotaxis family, CheB/CheR fusion protein
MRNADQRFPIVGVGASAGGLEAFTSLIEHLPDDLGIALLLVQHLDPEHKSLLTEILAKRTSLPVTEAKSGMEVEPHHLYVIPPNANMTLSQGKLVLKSREDTTGRHMPIDLLFESLAEDQGSNAIGVILSGTGSDGAHGAGKIKAAGGIVFAQDDASAKHNGMPRSAIAIGHVDFVLPPPEVARELVRISGHPYVQVEREEPSSSHEEDDGLKKLLQLVTASCGIDFTHYKQATIRRRISRRMMLSKLEKLDDYLKRLNEDPAEVHALCQDILIPVTGFFRDPETFKGLTELVFPRLLEGRSPKDTLRIWVPGCSTGEEVYSLAICLLEYLGDRAESIPIQLFGTDVNDVVIEKARAGIYVENIEAEVGPDRLRRFFTKIDGKYQVDKLIRSLCVFARQNLIKDPPFANLDMVSCRNVLIYLDEILQTRAMSVFHFALKRSGFLVLGTSETVGGFSELFETEDARRKLFKKRPVANRFLLDFQFASTASGMPAMTPAAAALPPTRDFQREVDRVLLSKFAPAGVVIDENMNILQFRGETGPYLEHRAGGPSFNLMRLARPGMLTELSTGIQQAMKDGGAVRKEGLRIKQEDRMREIDLEIVPVKVPLTENRCLLVLFEEVRPQSPERVPPPVAAGESRDVEDLARRVQQLEGELEATRDYLQSVNEEQEATNEELKTANEEILASNEELQSTNEEMQTSKEELESTNEELTTVNDELRSRNQELTQLNNDLHNVLTAMELPTLMLRRDLRVRRFTPSMTKLLSLAPTDIGRPLGHIKSAIDFPDLEKVISEVIETITVKEIEVQDKEGRWYVMRIRPYLTLDKKVDGALLTFIDVDLLKKSMEGLRRALDYAETIVNTVREPLLVLFPGLRVMKANDAFYRTFNMRPEETEGRFFYDLGGGKFRDPRLITLLEEVLPKNRAFHDFEVDCEFPGVGRKTLLLNARKIAWEAASDMILLAMEEITERKKSEEESRLLFEEQEARKHAEAANRMKDEFLSILSHELRTPLNAISGWVYLLRRGEQDEDTVLKGLETIERNVKAQTTLIEDLLDVSRINSGRIRLESRLVELAPILREASEAVRLSAENKSIRIECVSDPSVGHILGDPNRLRQIVLNLLSNAVKFTPKDGRVKVSHRRDNGKAVITVSDNGVGISGRFLPHVFEAFTLADATNTRRQGGLGLGLSIVKRLVDLHGGEVRAESDGEGKGSTFTVSFPLVESLPNNVKVEEEPALADPVAEESQDIWGIRILVVDDEADTRSLLDVLLRKSGAEVMTAISAPSALADLENWKPDILVADLAMPEEDGYSLIRKVRALGPKRGGRIPAIALTAFASAEAAAKSLEAGFQRHISKPVVPAELLATIASLVASHGQHGE